MKNFEGFMRKFAKQNHVEVQWQQLRFGYKRAKIPCHNWAEYLDDWLNDGACFTDFVEIEVDLTANDGLDDYGKCRCFLAPRTCEQHRKYRKLIPNPSKSEWTSTAFSTASNGYNRLLS